MSETKFSDGPWECVAAEFGEGENDGLVGFWVRMPHPSLCKADANLIEAALPMKEALKNSLAIFDCMDMYGKYKAVREQMRSALAKACAEAQ